MNASHNWNSHFVNTFKYFKELQVMYPTFSYYMDISPSNTRTSTKISLFYKGEKFVEVGSEDHNYTHRVVEAAHNVFASLLMERDYGMIYKAHSHEFSFPLPFQVHLQGKISPGQTLFISGSILEQAKHFEVKFLSNTG